MNFTFLNGAFLFAALAALLPLLIHLISRRRVSTVDFSSLRFLKELERKRIRRVRLRQILLLIVRSLIILAAALALARPTLKGTLAGGGAHARTSVAIVVDDSASMTRAPGGGDLLSEARAAAREIAGLLDDGDQAFLVAAGDPARAVLGEGTFSPDVLLEAVNAMEARDVGTDYSGAVDLALGLLGASRNLNRELYVLGDLQRTGWTRRAGGSSSERVGVLEGGTEARGSDDGPRAYLLLFDGPTANRGLSSAIVERKYAAAATAARVLANACARPTMAKGRNSISLSRSASFMLATISTSSTMESA